MTHWLVLEPPPVLRAATVVYLAGAAGTGAGVVAVPMPAVGTFAVGTADVPITGIFAQIDCNDIPLAKGAIAAAAFVASINI